MTNQTKLLTRCAMPQKLVRGLTGIFLMLACVVFAHAAAEPMLTDIETRSTANGYIEVELVFNAEVKEPKSFNTDSPSRIVLDFTDVKSSLKENKLEVGLGILNYYEVSQAGKRLRVVLDVKQQATHTVRVTGTRVYVTLKGRSNVVKRVNKRRFAANPWVVTKHSVRNIDFRRDDSGSGRVVVNLSDAKMGITVEKRTRDIVVEFIDTGLPHRLQRRLDVVDFGTPVDYIVSKQAGGNVRLVITAHGDFDQLSYQINNQFIVDISKQKSTSVLDDAEPTVYSGERLSLNFQDIPVRAVLQLLAEFTGVNIVASDSVRGNITLRLNNVPWDEALAIIMRTQGLDKRKVGNILMIAPQEEIAAREKEKLASSKEVEELEPLVTELVSLNYANSEEMQGLIKDQSTSLLSSRGSVNIDQRTNTLLIQDTENVLTSLIPLIKKLDVPVEQVLIEARIVTVDTDYEQDLGIRFGITHPTHVSGTITGANEINNNHIANETADTATNPLLNVAVNDRLNINLPADSANTPASIGVALAKLGRNYLLDLELSALETEGVGELIASPRLVTANQHEAYIEQGEEIPYQEATSSGATSVEFKKAVLALRVTPQITPDGKVIMNIKINQDRRSSAPEVLGVPAIDTEQIETRVLVDNGQTIVLGGIYSENKQHTVERIPFLGNLPIIGYLFKRTSDSDERRELLIFITPKIVQRTSVS